MAPDSIVDRRRSGRRRHLDAFALACHARRRGWDIRVESPYLPRELLRAAEPV
ncbi:Imm49 family immunity protein [Streptomyces anulatus]|uniref:Imm49 family immunity protein n=1 Tax=Streptomyces anulatus TaxID=1892 RepID=UPI0036774E54